MQAEEKQVQRPWQQEHASQSSITKEADTAAAVEATWGRTAWDEIKGNRT